MVRKFIDFGDKLKAFACFFIYKKTIRNIRKLKTVGEIYGEI
jgi:hypothetical protein